MKALLGSGKSLLSSPKSIFAMVSPANEAEPKSRPVKNVTISRSDNGGYIVEYYDGNDSVKHTYKNLKGVMGCLEETLESQKEASTEDESKE
jgi:hypothetical protein